MIPVVWSLSPALAFFSSTITLRPASAAARAQAKPAKLAPTTSRSTLRLPVLLPAPGVGAGAAEEAAGTSGEKRLEELCMRPLT